MNQKTGQPYNNQKMWLNKANSILGGAQVPLKLHLGCGEQHLPGYVNVDYPPTEHTTQIAAVADIFADITSLDFPDGSVHEVRSHHLFEHFDRSNSLALLIRWHKWLPLGGMLIIETPDIIGSFKQVIGEDMTFVQKQAVLRHIFGSQEARWAVHCDGWYKEKFIKVLGAFGFTATVQEKAWSRPPWLRNIIVRGNKSKTLDDHSLISAARLVHSWHMVDQSPCEIRKLHHWVAVTSRGAGLL
jgi:hypothetical protein